MLSIIPSFNLFARQGLWVGLFAWLFGVAPVLLLIFAVLAGPLVALDRWRNRRDPRRDPVTGELKAPTLNETD